MNDELKTTCLSFIAHRSYFIASPLRPLLVIARHPAQVEALLEPVSRPRVPRHLLGAYSRLAQQQRDQLGAPPHIQLDENLAQVKLDRLLADEEARADLCVRQPFGAAERDLRFASAQLVARGDAPDGRAKNFVAAVRLKLFRVGRAPC